MRTMTLAAIVIFLAGPVAWAQDRTPPAGGAPTQPADRSVAPTGQTVPLEGESKSEGVTPLEKGVERRDDAITKGICKGC